MDNYNDILTDGIDERIEAFLRGEMSAEEEAAFKQEINNNPDLRNRAMTMSALIKEVQAQNREKEQTVITTNTVKSKKRSVLLWACSIAAVFAIVFGVGLYNNHRRHALLEETLAPYYGRYHMDSSVRGDADSATIARLYSLFNQVKNQKDVSGVIKELEPIYRSLDEDFSYYPWANDIAWNLALAYIKDDQIDKAIPLLEKIKEDNPDTPISKKAEDLLKKIRAL